jgi:hypothetical protein
MLQIESFWEFFSYFDVTQRFGVFYNYTTRYNEKLRAGAEFVVVMAGGGLVLASTANFKMRKTCFL